MDTTDFANIGTLVAADGGVINLSAGGLTNLSGGILTGGTYEVDAGSTLQLPNNSPIVTDDADIILRGSGSTIKDLSSGAEQLIDFTLRTIGATGQLRLLGGRSLKTSAAFTVDAGGQLQMGGGTFAVTGLGSSLTNDGRLYGFGTVNATHSTNSGTVEASNGTLTIKKTVNGAGVLQADANADLVLGGAVAGGEATFNGADATFTLDLPASFNATVGGFGHHRPRRHYRQRGERQRLGPAHRHRKRDAVRHVAAQRLVFWFRFRDQAGWRQRHRRRRVAGSGTVAEYLTATSLYDGISGGFAISDTEANITDDLDQPNDADINTIAISAIPQSASMWRR